MCVLVFQSGRLGGVQRTPANTLLYRFECALCHTIGNVGVKCLEFNRARGSLERGRTKKVDRPWSPGATIAYIYLSFSQAPWDTSMTLLPWKSIGRPMEAPWKCHRCPTESKIPQKRHGSSTQTPRKSHGNSEVPRKVPPKYHGIPIEIPWKFHERTIEVPWELQRPTEVALKHHGSPMGAPKSHGSTRKLPWELEVPPKYLEVPMEAPRFL